MKTINLNKNKVALIDDEDFERVSRYNWTTHESDGCWYAYADIPNYGGICAMHRFILGLGIGEKEVVDHKNKDGLDNRKQNIRICTQSQNLARQKKRLGLSSKYKGVHWSKDRAKWVAQISVENKVKNLGRFSNEEEAAKAYDVAAKKEWGEFATLNFPDQA